MALAVVAEDVGLEVHHLLMSTLGVLRVLADDGAPVTREVPHLYLRENTRILELRARLDRHQSLEKVVRQVVNI